MACYSRKFKTKEPANKELKTTLIYEVKKRPPLWDETNKYWRNPAVTNDLWHEIGRYFGCPGPAIKQIWKNLRERYLIEITKEVNASKRKCCYKSKWYFYNQMSFLDSNYDRNKSYAWDNNEFCKSPSFTDFCELFDDRIDCSEKKTDTHVYSLETDSTSNEDIAGPSDKMEEDKQDIKVFVQKKGKKSRTPTKKQGKLESSSQQVVHVPKEEKKKREKKDKDLQVVPYKKEKDEKDQQIVLSTLNENLFSTNSRTKQTVQTFTHDNSPFCELNCEPCCSIAQSKTSKEPSCKEARTVEAYTNISGFDLKMNANHQFLMSLLPYLDELTQSECLETRAQIQCVISEAFRRRQNPCSFFQTGGYAPTDLFRQ